MRTALHLCRVCVGVLVFAPLPTWGQVYWSDSEADSIARANQIDGADVEMIVNMGHIAPGLALDGPAEHIYWSRGHGTQCMPPAQDECGAIYRSHLDGTQTVLLVGPMVYGALGIDLDAGHLYWTGGPTGELKSIRRANLDGTGVNVVYTTATGGVWGIALDVEAGKMHWTEPSAVFPRIRRANLDGSMPETVLDETSLTTDLRDIAVNAQAGKMLGASAQSPKLRRSTTALNDPPPVIPPPAV